MSDSGVFTKDNLDTYLKELAKEFRKLNGTAMPAEIVLIGGAAVLTNYGFRDMTTDIDAVIRAAAPMKDAINRVGDKFGLPNGWLNADFMKTASFSPKLLEVSEYYRTFSNVLQVRCVSAEYLVAMKLRAGRKYKNDLSDIIGILAEHEKRGQPITLDKVEQAVEKLYGGWSEFPAHSREFISDAIRTGNYESIYLSVQAGEKQTKNTLVHFEKEYPNALTESNVNDIIEALKRKKAAEMSEREQPKEVEEFEI